jgi:hypothetical protein
LTPAAINTSYITDIYLLLSQSTTSSTLTVYAQSGNASNPIAIQPGSFCSYLP